MSSARLTHPVTLANGARVPLQTAAADFGRLRAYLADPDAEWDVVYYLRELCLGRAIEPEQLRALVGEGLVDSSGRPDDALRAVVLSAVRGEGRQLHLDSPFTDATDRALAEFVAARDHLHAYLERDELRGVLDDPLQRDLDQLPPPRWTDRETRPTDPPGDLPPR